MIVRRWAAIVVGSAIMLTPATGRAQESIVTGLLTRAKNALNDLKYVEADSMAKLVIALGEIVPKPQRVEALQIAAAARFPEEAKFQKPSSALDALKSIVQLGHTAPIPFDVGWVGLDSLYASVGGSVQSRAEGAQAVTAADAASGPSLAETGQWLLERVPGLTGISWRDSSAVSLNTASEKLAELSVNSCTLKYKVQHREDDIWYEERNRKNSFKYDSSFTFEARALDPKTFESGNVDLSMQLFGVLRGKERSQVGFLRVTERAAAGKTPRRLTWSFPNAAQARRVRNALERLVVLCQKELF